MHVYPQTQQEIFNTVVTHLYEQGMPSTSYEGCAYRSFATTDQGEKTLKCAVGVFLPDEFCEENIEGLDVGGLIDNFGSKMPPDLYEFLEINHDLLKRLQEAHDGIDPTVGIDNHFLLHMTYIAKQHDLNQTVLHTAHQNFIKNKR